jgi:hypothetical protein
MNCGILDRDDRIRTCGICSPNTALYQAELHPGTIRNKVTMTIRSSASGVSLKNLICTRMITKRVAQEALAGLLKKNV